MKGIVLCIHISLYIVVVCFVANVILIQIIIKHCLHWVTCNYSTSNNKNTFDINITLCSSPTTMSQWTNICVVVMTISFRNMQVACWRTIMAIEVVITIVGNTIGCFTIFIKFDESWLIFNGGCWGMSLNKRWNSLHS